MTMTSNLSKFLRLLRKSPRSSNAKSSPGPTASGSDLNTIPAPAAPGDVLWFQWQSIKADEARSGVLDTSIAILRDAASLASNIPYMGAIAGMIVQIIRIRDEVDLYREMWEDLMYNVVKVVELVKHFSASCQRHGLCDEKTFPQDFIAIINELESEFVKVTEVLSRCRGRTKFERFMGGLVRNDMVIEINRCDRHMNRIFERFMAAMVVDIRFQQLLAEKTQSVTTSISVPQGIPMSMIPHTLAAVPTPTSMIIPLTNPTHTLPVIGTESPALLFPQPHVAEPLALASSSNSHVQYLSQSVVSSPVQSFLRPVRPQVFFGRDAELKKIVDMIFSPASPARVAILGPGGVGKTALAHAVLTHDRVMSRFGDSRYLIPCESLNSREALVVALANRLSLLQPGTTSEGYVMGIESRVLSVLASEDCILCLDDFESPWDQPLPIRRAVEHLLAEITVLPSVTVLITMRGGERPKETAWTLPMLPPLTSFNREAAKGTWECLAGTCDEWAEKLIDAVDCLPLAVTILGSLAEVSTAETLWERWQEENIAVVENEKGDKFSSLDFSIALSLESGRMAADSSSRRLLGILSLLPDGLPTSAPQELRRHFPDIPDISRSLDTLLARSLAVRTADKRVQVNSLVRLYSENHGLAAPKDRRALGNYYVTLASRAYNDLGPVMFERMRAEMNNMGSVLQKSLAWTPPSEITPVVEAVIAYTQFCSYIGNFSDAVIACAVQVPGLSDETLGDCLASLGSIYLGGGKVIAAQEHFSRALAHHQKAQDSVGEANDYCRLGDVLYRRDDIEEAKTRHQNAYGLYVRVNNTKGQASALRRLGDAYKKLGDLEKSCSHYRRSLTIHRGRDDRLGQANCLKGLGHVYLRMDDVPRARECFEQALELHETVNDVVGQANDMSSLADIYQRLDDSAMAEEAYKRSLDLHNQVNDGLGIGNALGHLGNLYRKQNKLSEAEEHYTRALQSHEKASDMLGLANDLKGLGGIYHKMRDNSKAIDKYNAALILYEAIQNSLGKANCQRSIGQINYSRNMLHDASKMFQSALENYQRVNDSIGQGNALNGLGDVERRSGSLGKAEQLYQQALEAHRRAEDRIGQGNAYKGLGILYEKQSRLKDAKEMFEMAVEMHKRSGLLRSEKQDEVYLEKVYKKLARGPRITK